MSLPHNPDDLTAGYVISRLEEASATMAALPSNAPALAQRVQTYGFVPEITKDTAKVTGGIANKSVSTTDITQMDEAFCWFAFIENVTKRRIVAVRSMVNIHTGRHVYSWRDIGKIVNASKDACINWHRQAISQILTQLRLEKFGRIGKWDR